MPLFLCQLTCFLIFFYGTGELTNEQSEWTNSGQTSKMQPISRVTLTIGYATCARDKLGLQPLVIKFYVVPSPEFRQMRLKDFAESWLCGGAPEVDVSCGVVTQMRADVVHLFAPKVSGQFGW